MGRRSPEPELLRKPENPFADYSFQGYVHKSVFFFPFLNPIDFLFITQT